MCIDYRSLDQATFKDRYSIPVINKLLDELCGTIIFSNWTLGLVTTK